MSLDGPTVIGGHELWFAATAKGTKLILFTRGRAEILDNNSIESAIRAVAQLQSAFALERMIALAGATIAFGLLTYSLSLMVFGDGGTSVATLASLIGLAGLLLTMSSLWLRAGSRKFDVLLESGRRLTVDRNGLSPTGRLADELPKKAARVEESDG